MFENSNHGHWELFVPKTRWGGLLLKKLYTFVEVPVTQKAFLKLVIYTWSS